MRGHGDEVTAAGTSGFDDGLIRFPMLYFHHLTRDADLLGLLLCLGEARLGLSMGTARVLIWRVVRLWKAPQYGEWLYDGEHCDLRPETLGERDALLHGRAGERRTVGGGEYMMVHGDLSCQSVGARPAAILGRLGATGHDASYQISSVRATNPRRAIMRARRIYFRGDRTARPRSLTFTRVVCWGDILDRKRSFGAELDHRLRRGECEMVHVRGKINEAA